MTQKFLNSRLNPPDVTLDYITGLKDQFFHQAARGYSRLHWRNIFNSFARGAHTYSGVRIHYLSDNGGMDSDLAKAEIKKELAEATLLISNLSGKPPIPFEYDDIPSQDSFAGAFDLAQLSRNTIRGIGNIVFLNCAPRKKERGVEKNNGGEAVFIGMLPNGTIISATSTESFAFFKDLIASGDLEIFQARVQKNGSQFRSRDIFPWFCALMADRVAGQYTTWKPVQTTQERRHFLESTLKFIEFENKLDINAVPDLPLQIVRSDTHGNLKLNIRHEDIRSAFPDEQFFWAVVNKNAVRVCLNKDSFSGPAQQFVLSEGSDGRWKNTISGKALSGFAELFLVGGRAINKFSLRTEDFKKGIDVSLISEQLLERYKRMNPSFCYGGSGAESLAKHIVRIGLVKGLDNTGLAQEVSRLECGARQTHPALQA